MSNIALSKVKFSAAHPSVHLLISWLRDIRLAHSLCASAHLFIEFSSSDLFKMPVSVYVCERMKWLILAQEAGGTAHNAEMTDL